MAERNAFTNNAGLPLQCHSRLPHVYQTVIGPRIGTVQSNARSRGPSAGGWTSRSALVCWYAAVQFSSERSIVKLMHCVTDVQRETLRVGGMFLLCFNRLTMPWSQPRGKREGGVCTALFLFSPKELSRDHRPLSVHPPVPLREKRGDDWNVDALVWIAFCHHFVLRTEKKALESDEEKCHETPGYASQVTYSLHLPLYILCNGNLQFSTSSLSICAHEGHKVSFPREGDGNVCRLRRMKEREMETRPARCTTPNWNN